MTATQNLEVKGKLRDHPLIEILAEISYSHVNGSLRISNEAQKVVIYLRDGSPVFVASNSRRHRLFETLLQSSALTKETLGDIPDFTNDLTLRKALIERKILPELDCEHLFVQLLRNVLASCFEWREGEWLLSPMQRIKEDISFDLGAQQLMLEYARKLSPDYSTSRFRSLDETFAISEGAPVNIGLLPAEAFLLSRFDGKPMCADELKTLSGMPTEETMHALYVLWLGGFVSRRYSNHALKEEFLSRITDAKLELKKQTPKFAAPKQDEAAAEETPANETQEAPVVAPSAEKEDGLTLKQFLKRVEESATHYELFNLEMEADIAEIKKSYFSLAKRFHPDRYYAETDEKLLAQIQSAFTEIAHAYEVLKDPKSREVYDYRLRKALAEFGGKPKPVEKEPEPVSETMDPEELFDKGFEHFMEEKYTQAASFFGRAAKCEPKAARYHAYFGRALSFNPEEKHRAESELQLALKLDPPNPIYRMMLCEFLSETGLTKRAIRELNLLLEITPDYKEAKELLERISIE
jgi:tetratricopeptide (TPR) repeat protein